MLSTELHQIDVKGLKVWNVFDPFTILGGLAAIAVCSMSAEVSAATYTRLGALPVAPEIDPHHRADQSTRLGSPAILSACRASCIRAQFRKRRARPCWCFSADTDRHAAVVLLGKFQLDRFWLATSKGSRIGLSGPKNMPKVGPSACQRVSEIS